MQAKFKIVPDPLICLHICLFINLNPTQGVRGPMGDPGPQGPTGQVWTPPSVVERRGNSIKRFKGFNLKAKAHN